MKKELRNIFGIGLVVVLLISLFGLGIPASAGNILEWDDEGIPDTDDEILAPGTDVRDVAVSGDGQTIYALAPYVSAAIFEANANAEDMGWSTASGISGNTSAMLQDGWSAIKFYPPDGITLADLQDLDNEWSFWYFLDTDSAGPQFELKFENPGDTTEFVDLTIMAAQSGSAAVDAWTEIELAGTTTSVGIWGTDHTFDAGAGKDLATQVAAVIADTDCHDGWELAEVQIELYEDLDDSRICYVDDITIDGVTYGLEGTAESFADGEAIAGRVYKSGDAGETWTELDGPSGAVNEQLIAIALEDSDVGAIIADDNEVYVTLNGGSSWKSAMATVQDGAGDIAAVLKGVDVAPDGGDVAVCGSDDAGEANMWYYNLAIGGSWTETKGLGGFSSADSVLAVAFSPNFSSDKVMVVVSEEGNTDATDFQMYSESSELWNVDAGFADYPAELLNDGGDNTENATLASIALAPTYLGSDDTERVAFVGLTTAVDEADSGIFRLEDDTDEMLKDEVYIHSVAYDGTNLVAGANDTNVSYYCDEPLDSSPTVSSARSLKRASGESKVVVAWAGENVVAGTSGDNSGFSVSANNGKTFNDISLIDATIVSIKDFAVSPDASKIYLLTSDNVNFSLWRQASDWERVLSDASAEDFIVRLAPEDDDVVYVCETGSDNVWYSKEGGQEKWFARTCGVDPVDLAVESADVAYAVDSSGNVDKTENAGFTWDGDESTKLGNAATIISVQEDVVVVGGTSGYVSYSLDGYDSWTKIDKSIQSGAGNVQVAADTDFANNNTIYGASDEDAQNVERFIIGESSSWSDIYDGTLGPVYGLATVGTTLYAVTSDGVDTILEQCLKPLTADDSSPSWDSETASGEEITLTATPRALKSSAGSNVLWAIDTTAMELYNFADTVAAGGLTLTAPADGYSNPVNNVTGKANEIAFRWEQLSESTEYKLYIAYDADFDQTVTDFAVEEDGDPVVQLVGPDQTGPTSDDEAKVNFMPGTTYYWRVKATAPLTSPYSEVRSFTIEPGVALVPAVLSPENGVTGTSQMPSFSWSPVSGTTMYRFVLANNPALTAPIVDITTGSTAYAVATELALDTTYYWAVQSIEPVEGGFSAISNFTVMGAPVEAPPPVEVKEVPAPVINIPPAPAPPPDIVIPPAPPPPAPIAPAYIWAVIIIGAVLVIAVIVLIVRTRRTV
jgi:hypothetical protein